jgi:hypothetical protein
MNPIMRAMWISDLHTSLERVLRKLACLAFLAMLTACTDGATRIAYDIESNVAAFNRTNATASSIKHTPEPSPEGCNGPYKVQLSERSSLVIWCKNADSSKITSSHTTTYHLRFVDVPRQFIVDKSAGEALFIDVEKQNGKVVVVGLR